MKNFDYLREIFLEKETVKRKGNLMLGVSMRAVINRPPTANRYNRQPPNRYNRLTA